MRSMIECRIGLRRHPEVAGELELNGRKNELSYASKGAIRQGYDRSNWSRKGAEK